MSSNVSAIASERAAPARDSERRRERYFFSGMAILMALTVAVGFAPSYYFRPYFASPPPLTTLLHIHGVIFTLWIVLLVTQTTLVAANRTALHRRFGVAGAVLAVLMMVVGGSVAITRAQAGILGPPGGPPPLVFLAIPLATLVVFPVLFGSALYFRKVPDFHKRLVMLANVEIVTAAFGRIMSGGPLVFFGTADLFVVAIAIYDLATRKRLHPATLWGGVFLIASQPLRLIVTQTPLWHTFTQWLTT